MLTRAINSVLNQTYTEIECIVVDDFSNDDTPGVINLFEDNRLLYVRHEINKGASAARNNGIRLSKGELISFLDDDDEWMHDKLEKQVDLLEKTSHNVGLVYCWMSYIKNDKELYRYQPNLKGYIFKDMLDKQAIGNSSTLLIRRSVVNDIGDFDESLPRGNDGDYIRRICRKYYVEFFPEVLVKLHVDHGSKRISDDNKESIEQIIQSLKIRFDKFPREIKEFPDQAASICVYIALNYAKISEIGKSLYWAFNAILKSPLNLKIYIRIFRLIIEQLLFSKNRFNL